MRRRGAGFTVQKPTVLSIVVVVIAALVAWPVVRTQWTRRRENARLLADLARLDALEAAHKASYGYYTGQAARAAARGIIAFVPSPGVSVFVVKADSAGWSAVATAEPDVPSAQRHACGVFVGLAKAAPNPAVTKSGRPACW